MRRFLTVFLVMVMIMGTIAGIGCGEDETTTAPTTAPTAAPITWHYWCSVTPAAIFPADWHSETFAEEVTENSGGRLTIKVHYAGDLPFASADFLKVVGNGDLEIGYSGGSYMQLDMRQLAHYQTPFLIGDPFWENMFAVLDDPEIKATRDAGFDKLNLKELAIFSSEPDNLLTKDPITEISDLNGMEMRAWSPALIDTFKTLGAVPHTIPFGEMYLALSTGLVDGTSNSVLVITGFKLWEVIDYILDLPIVTQSVAMVVNKDAYEALPADLQDIVDEAAQRFEENCRAEYFEAAEGALATALAEGMQQTQLEPGEYEKLMVKMYALWDEKADTFSGDSLKVWNRIWEIMGY